MATMTEMQQKLQAKLKELFQLDQPDLDFGFYRVMHAKRKVVSEFLDEKLPKIIETSFADIGNSKLKTDLDTAKNALLAALGPTALNADGSINPTFAATPLAVQYLAAKKAFNEGMASAGAATDIYDHLYHFFERYYDKGDFVSLRYLTRETDRKAKPYAIPYAGEEVMLHWANADQYYIKTSENFSSYTFDLSEAPEFKKMDEMERMTLNLPNRPMRVHFKIVEAEEGEHGNVKPGADRFFIVHKDKAFDIPDAPDAELTVYFEYRADPEKEGTTGKWQAKRCKEAAEFTLNWLTDFAGSLADEYATHPINAYIRMLSTACPTEKNPTRNVLERYIERFTARNTEDYFIHKDLGGFLRRELDFYIKNDLMILDDVTAATPEAVAKWLSKLQVFRKIAGEIITFLAQLEDFQKKLWLKKKFVVQCDYCITMDQVPDDMKAEVLANEAQQAEWEKYGIEVDPKTVDMHALDARMVDTKFFDESFKARLLASIPDLDERCDGLLIHSENFGALNFMQERFREQVKCIYIDPPYNTGEGDFLYSDSFMHSSWAAMMVDRLAVSKSLLMSAGMLGCHIDEHEHDILNWLFSAVFGNGNLGPLIWDKRNPKGDVAGIASQHEYLHFATKDRFSFASDDEAFIRDKPNAPAMLKKAEQLIRRSHGITEKVRKAFADWVSESNFSKGEKAYHFIDDNGDVYRLVSMAWPNKKKAPDEYFKPLIHPITNKPCPIPERGWRNPPETMDALLKSGKIIFGVDETTQPQRKYLLKENMTEMVPSLYYMGGSDDKMFGDMDLYFENPKPIQASEYFLSAMARRTDAFVLDYFAGSGTTAHAVLDMNRQDKANGIDARRKYILVEMGDHFDTVLKPRIEKVVYSPDWKDGKPQRADRGISHCFKYLRLESYEDTLNNLVVDGEKGKAYAGIGDYFFKYMLDVETNGSPSLLNVAQFANPFNYKLFVKKPGSEEREERTVDLIETFNYLIGLRVQHVAEPQTFAAEFERKPDPELPEDAHTKLTVKELRAAEAGDGAVWKFQMVEGWMPKNRATPDDGAKERVLVVWRTLTGDIEKDNAVLNAYLQAAASAQLGGGCDIVYVNGSNNVPLLQKDGDSWNVRLIEEDFLARMWEGV